MKDIGSMFKKISRYAAINILIAIISLTIIIITMSSMLAYRNPSNLEETTGTVAKFEWRERDWLDSVANTPAPYFRVWFTDDSYYEATGICYDNIDKKLFEALADGDEITLTYSKRIGSNKTLRLSPEPSPRH